MNNKTNDQVILEQIIKEQYENSDEDMNQSDFFEFFSASEILKNYDLTYDDIKYGIIGNSQDGGIDSIHTFLNGEQLKEDTYINSLQRRNHIELIIIQSKTSSGFSEDTINKFRETAQDLFNLSHNLESFSNRYNSELLSRIQIFRSTHAKLSTSFPKLSIKYYYATQGNEVHPNTKGKVPKLEADIKNLFSGSEFSFDFITASKLLELTRDMPILTRILEVSESPIATAEGSYLCLVSLSKYFHFISDEGSLSRSIFESNVRDYQGSVIVNKGIKDTLKNKNSENFWYLNNGVTIITPKATLAGKQLTIEDPQIVNGLQTSHEIYQHFSSIEKDEIDTRTLLIRIITENNEEARDRIIRATNSQTSIPPASLRSSDDIHRNIEDYLKANGYYYDRKKNYYKNQKKPSSKIISIPYMAQIMMSIVLQKPHVARSRPSTLINSDNEYGTIFSTAIPIDIYLKVIKIMKQVEIFLKNKNLENKTITNIRYYIAMVVAFKIINSSHNIILNLSKVTLTDKIENKILEESFSIVHTLYHNLGSSDQVAKSSNMLVKLLEEIE